MSQGSQSGRGHRSCGVCADDQQLFQQMRRTLTQQAAEGSKPAVAASPALAGGSAQVAGASATPAAIALSATTAALSTAAASSPSTAAPSPSSAAAAAVAAPVPPSSGPASAGVAPLPCPPDSRSLGRATWTFLHTMAAWFPERPSAAEQSRMATFIGHFAHLYPCSYCAGHLQEHVAAHPPPTHSRRALTNFFCDYHNDVNRRLGKRQFDCGRYDERWRFGPPAGANYDCIEEKQNAIEDSSESDSE